MSTTAPATVAPQAFEIEGYEALEEIGRGGAGVVYRARHKALNREVALKVILDTAHSSREDRARFKREAEATARLRHPGIVQIYEVGEVGGRPYMALEFVEGGSLHDQLGREAQPLRWAAAVVRDLAITMAYTHEHGIIHRDLKPANVLVMASGETGQNGAGRPQLAPASGTERPLPEIKLTDFGLARELRGSGDLTQMGVPMGTPAYMAPEQAAGDLERIGPAADIYALGAILYRLLTGQPPFVSKDPYTTFEMILHDEPRPVRELRADVPADLQTICMKCLGKRPEERYASAQDLADDLGRFLEDEPIAVRPHGPVERFYRWARRKPMLALSYILGSAFYLLHLFSMLVLDTPSHQGAFHWRKTAIVATFLVVASIAQRLFESGRRSAGEMLFALAPVAAATASFAADMGPLSGPVPVYLPIIACSAIFAPRPAFIWFVTGAAVVGYLSLVVHHLQVRPELALSTESVLAFVVCEIAMGLIMHLLVRKAST